MIYNNKLFNVNSTGGQGYVKKPFGQSWYKVPDGVDEQGLMYKSPF